MTLATGGDPRDTRAVISAELAAIYARLHSQWPMPDPAGVRKAIRDYARAKFDSPLERLVVAARILRGGIEHGVLFSGWIASNGPFYLAALQTFTILEDEDFAVLLESLHRHWQSLSMNESRKQLYHALLLQARDREGIQARVDAMLACRAYPGALPPLPGLGYLPAEDYAERPIATRIPGAGRKTSR